MQRVVDGKVADVRQRGRIPLQRARWLMMVPDPSGLLAPDEVFIRLRDGGDDGGSVAAPLEATVLLARSPCQAPWDVAAFRAVRLVAASATTPRALPQLDAAAVTPAQWEDALVDVVVLSVRGPVSPASRLSGGDYDGDLACVVWEPRLVDPVCSRQRALASSAEVMAGGAPASTPSTTGVVVPAATPQPGGGWDGADMAAVYCASLSAPALGTATNLHLAWVSHYLARAAAPVAGGGSGALTPLHEAEPLALARLCAACVDAPKTGAVITIPPSLRRVPTPPWLTTPPTPSSCPIAALFAAAAAYSPPPPPPPAASTLPPPSRAVLVAAELAGWRDLETAARIHADTYAHDMRAALAAAEAHGGTKAGAATTAIHAARARFLAVPACQRRTLALAYYMVTCGADARPPPPPFLAAFPWRAAADELLDAVLEWRSVVMAVAASAAASAVAT